MDSKTITLSLGIDKILLNDKLPNNLNESTANLATNSNQEDATSEEKDPISDATESIENVDHPQDLNDKSQDLVCFFCFKSVHERNVVTLNACMHTFCRQCLILVIEKEHDVMTRAVKCPIQTENCKSYLEEREIKEILGDRYADYKSSLLAALLNMDLDYIENWETFKCEICLEQIEAKDGIILQKCPHEFCKNCLRGFIEASETFRVKCPTFKCEKILEESEVRSLVSNETFARLLRLTLITAENQDPLKFHCRTPGCEYFVIIEGEVPSFTCEICLKVNCVQCKEIHEGKTCIEYRATLQPGYDESEEAILQSIAANEAMNCPNCSSVVMKEAGCDFLTCLSCKQGICWATKKPRHDLMKANGILIEGCKCREPPLNELCHPNCGNCH